MKRFVDSPWVMVKAAVASVSGLVLIFVAFSPLAPPKETSKDLDRATRIVGESTTRLDLLDISGRPLLECACETRFDAEDLRAQRSCVCTGPLTK
jgi:hypothetical protein